MSTQPQLTDAEREILSKLFNIKKSFHAEAGVAIGQLSDTIAGMLQQLGSEMINAEKKRAELVKVNLELRKELDGKKSKTKN